MKKEVEKEEKGCINLNSTTGKYPLEFHVAVRLCVEYKPKETLTDLSKR